MRWATDNLPCKYGIDDCSHPDCFRERVEYVRAFYAMNGDPLWRCKDGAKLLFSEMETSHIRNCVEAASRGYTNDRQPFKVKNPLKLARLKLELAFRETNHV